MNSERIIDKEKTNIDEIKRRINDFKPRKFLTFFDQQNFWLTPYNPEIFPCIMLINDSGESLFISNCNCGYGGHGPQNTQSVLRALGMQEDFAEKLIYNNSIQFSFTDKGEIDYNSIKTNSPFETREAEVKTGQIFIGSDTHTVYNPRRIYLFGSQLKDLQATERFVKLLNLSKPYKVVYHIKNYDEELLDSYMPNYFYESKINLLKKSRIHYVGNNFEIVLFEDLEDAVAVVNMVHRCLTGKSLWDFNIVSDLIWYGTSKNELSVFSTIMRIVKSLLHFKNRVDIKGMEVY